MRRLDQLFIGTQRNILHGLHLSRDYKRKYSVHYEVAVLLQTTIKQGGTLIPAAVHRSNVFL
jgi:hypothetical protein